MLINSHTRYFQNQCTYNQYYLHFRMARQDIGADCFILNYLLYNINMLIYICLHCIHGYRYNINDNWIDDGYDCNMQLCLK